jgi:hypothetical protein
MRTIVAAIVTGGLLGGCGYLQLAMLTSGAPGSLLKTPDGIELVMGACVAGLSATCLPITKTDNAADEEAWRYVMKTAVRDGWGIPQGEAPVSVYVLGPLETCQTMARRATKLPADRGALCDGPFYFKRG